MVVVLCLSVGTRFFVLLLLNFICTLERLKHFAKLVSLIESFFLVRGSLFFLFVKYGYVSSNMAP